MTRDIDNNFKPEYSIHLDFPDNCIKLGEFGKIKLFGHKDGDWTEPWLRKRHCQLIDDGNGVDISFKNGPHFSLDYCQAYELFILLKLERQQQHERNPRNQIDIPIEDADICTHCGKYK